MTTTSNPPSVRNAEEIKQEILKLPKETQHALASCMATRGLFTTSLPIGILTAFITNRLIAPTKLKKMTPILEIVTGLFGYGFTRLTISGECIRQYVPNFMQLSQSAHVGQDYYKNPMSSDSLENPQEEDTTWNSFDTFSSDSGDQFPTTDRGFDEEDLTTETRANDRKTVTYEQLRRRNRASYDNSRRERNPRSNAEVPDDSWSWNAESSEKNIWG